MNRKEFKNIAGRISEGTASEQDIARYNFYYNHFQSETSEILESTEEEFIEKELRSRISLGRPAGTKHMYPYWKAAAAIVLLATAVFLFRNNTHPKQTAAVQSNEERFKYDADPGGNKAVLTLADGSVIVLNEAGNGVLADQGGTSVSKAKEGQLVYDASAGAVSPKLAYNTISIPRGGQYQITLPDGTKVWLNSSSSLTFPTAFTGKERKVELRGEAYFEVAKVKRRRQGAPSPQKGEMRIPFIVESGSQQIEVLGTHFNVMAYNDEAAIKTTLLEGSVKVLHLTSHISHLLKPGQQALMKSGTIKVAEVDTEEAVAWKNGMFQFNNTDMQTVMRQLERWYNVEVDEDNMPHKRFNGIISRDVPLSQVLKMMEVTSGLRFKIENTAGKSSKAERRIVMGE